MKRLWSILVLLVAISLSARAFADVSEATFTPQGSEVFEAVPLKAVQVFVFRPSFKFKVIGLLEARGMAEVDNSLFGQVDNAVGALLGDSHAAPGEKEDIALAMKALREEAAQNGATGVVILKSIQVRVSQSATERRIVAAAIRAE